MTVTQLTAVLTWFGVTFARRATSRILLGLPATMAHEAAHWVVALITGSRPGLPSIWPRREGDGWVLGSVQFVVYPRVAGVVALAPLWCLAPLAWWLVTGATSAADALWYQFALGILAGYCAVGSVPSTQDWYVALKYPIGSMAVLAVLAAAVHLMLNP
jgi:hypothetical protein